MPVSEFFQGYWKRDRSGCTEELQNAGWYEIPTTHLSVMVPTEPYRSQGCQQFARGIYIMYKLSLKIGLYTIACFSGLSDRALQPKQYSLVGFV